MILRGAGFVACIHLAAAGVSAGAEEIINVGMIGLDTSHVMAFTKAFNDTEQEGHVPGIRVVAAYKGGSPDVEASAGRIERFTNELVDEWNIELVDSIPELCEKVDGVLIMSVDGRPHLEQAKPVIDAGLPFFIDKPLAGSLADGIEIARLAKEKGVPWWSASSLRFWSETQRVVNAPELAKIHGCGVHAPISYEPHHPDLFWYGIHGVEMIYAAMGRGCETVSRTQGEDADVVVGHWRDGRVATYRGIREGKKEYGMTVYGENAILSTDPAKGSLYHGLLVEIAEFFRTKKPPVDPLESLEMLAFMEAADRSLAEGGKPVEVEEVILE
jgi:predicted dehydrogenase